MSAHSHKTVSLTYTDGTSVDIDEGISDLIQLMWDTGIRTSSCCQNGAESVYTSKGIYIQFDDGASALKFINIIADYDGGLWDAVQNEEGFSFYINIPDRNMGHGSCPHFDFNVNMTFDPKYKDKIMERLSLHNKI